VKYFVIPYEWSFISERLPTVLYVSWGWRKSWL